jgi:hypothetical protein
MISPFFDFFAGALSTGGVFSSAMDGCLALPELLSGKVCKGCATAPGNHPSSCSGKVFGHFPTVTERTASETSQAPAAPQEPQA